MNSIGNENELQNANNYVDIFQISRHKWKPITEVPAIFFAKVGAAVMLNRKRLVQYPFLLDNNTMAYSFEKGIWNISFGKSLFETIDLTSLVQVGALPSYNASDVEDIKIFLPSLPEQARIGTFFRQLDRLITLHQCNCNMATRPCEWSSGLRAIAWEQRKLGEIGTSFDYGLNAAAKPFDGKNRYIRITDIDDNSRSFLQTDLTSPDTNLDQAKSSILQEGDIVFARTGASVGKTYIYNKNDGLVYFAGFLIRVRVKPEYNVDFVFQNTLTKNYAMFINITSQRSGQPGVNAQEYASFTFLTPTLPEQARIGAFFRHLDRLVALHQRKHILLT